MSHLLKLKDATPLAQGHSRLVFQHPHRKEWLIKVIRPDVIEKRFGSGTAWYKRKRRYGRYLSYMREIQEYVAVWAKRGESLHFAQKIIGFETTDLGLGLVIEAARDADGGLAPNLGMLISTGCYNEKVKADLEEFLNQLLAVDVIISDLNVGNLVYAYNQDAGRHFVLIDGLGNNNIWPLKALSRRINRWSKRGRFARLYRKVDFLLAKHGNQSDPSS
jgi:hypothetical protein